jgi:hypothetical protein
LQDELDLESEELLMHQQQIDVVVDVSDVVDSDSVEAKKEVDVEDTSEIVTGEDTKPVFEERAL